jgi:hypothetical protein
MVERVKLTIAKQDCTVVDATGVARKVFAGRPIPTSLLDAYKAATKPPKVKAVEPEVIKADLAPELDKAQRAPEVRKSSRRRSQ